MKSLNFITAMLISITSFQNTSLAQNSSVKTFNQLESLKFSHEEISRHQDTLNIILRDSYNCINAVQKKHQAFYDEHGISAYYGDRSSFAKMSTIQKKDHIESLGKDPDLLDQMGPISCVGLTLMCFEKSFAAADQKDIWQKIKTFTRANQQDGSAMQHALQKLGWKIFYWNPDTSKNELWDSREEGLESKGWHSYRWTTVKSSKHNYYFNKVDNWTSLVNFGTSIPAGFKKVPFYVGTAHTGYHVFPGGFGKVIEGHSMRRITDPNTVESSEFNPLKTNGGPRGQYFSGLIAIPPGYDF